MPLLSSQQLEILELLAKGQTYRQIAAKMHISPSTVKYHNNIIYTKMQVKNRMEAITEAAKRGRLVIRLEHEYNNCVAFFYCFPRLFPINKLA